jgi:hypothetical protein
MGVVFKPTKSTLITPVELPDALTVKVTVAE